ncbi:MAG TPA: M15 family metallopeptidase [Spirochaetia bacterium]
MIPRRVVLLLAAACVIALAPAVGAAGKRNFKGFAMTADDLRLMVAPLPAAIRTGILATPEDFLSRVARVLDQPADLFVLVDKKHLLPADEVPPDLVLLKDYGFSVSQPGLQVRKAVVPALQDMVKAAREEGITLLCSSAYRSYDYQVTVYNREVKLYGQATADRESARPGASQHQLGTAIDFGSISDAFADTRAGRWLAANAETYGFSLSFPKGYEEVTGYRWESWHYRYVTPAGTDLQKRYFGDVQQYMIEFLGEHRATLEAKRGG